MELATFHRAKGLEWTAVNVVGLEDGFVPIVYAQSDQARAEERRLLYVAITRASVICTARGREPDPGHRTAGRASAFSLVVSHGRGGTHRNGEDPPRDTGRWIADIRATLSLNRRRHWAFIIWTRLIRGVARSACQARSAEASIRSPEMLRSVRTVSSVSGLHVRQSKDIAVTRLGSTAVQPACL